LSEPKNVIFAEERKIKILEIIKSRKKITVPELCEIFEVSGATIRNDLRELQKSGALTRTHGGAIEKVQTGFELKSNQRQVQNLPQKKAVAELALNLINDGDKIIIDTGTTTLELAKLLHEKQNLTVLTNDITIAGILEDFDSVEIFVLGGFLRKHFHCTISVPGQFIYTGLTVDKAFMGANSLSLVKGATTPDIGQAETKKALIKMANKVILLCDNSKMEQVSFAQFATLEDIDTIVTNDIDIDRKKQFEEQGIEIIKVPSG